MWLDHPGEPEQKPRRDVVQDTLDPMADNSYWDGKVHKAVKFGNPHSIPARWKAVREQCGGRYRHDVRKRRLRRYEPKSSPGVSGGLSSTDSGAAEAGSISSGLSFFT